VFARRRAAWWLLWLPLPFLYWSVAVPYLLFACLAVAYRRIRSPTVGRWVLVNAAAILLIGIAMLVLFRAASLLVPGLATSRFAELRFEFLWSPTLCVAALSYAVVLLTGAVMKRELPQRHHFAHISLVGCQLLLANLHILAGAQLDPRQMQNTSGVTWAAMSLVLAGVSIGALVSGRPRAAKMLRLGGRWLLLVLILGSLLMSQGFDFARFRFRVFLGHDISREEVAKVIDDPLHAVFTWYGTSSHMSLVAPRIAIPPLSYQYSFQFINRLCPHTEDLIRRARNFVLEHAVDNENLAVAADHLLEYSQRCLDAFEADRRDTDGLCMASAGSYESDEFFVVETRPTQVWAHVPPW